LDIEHLDHKDEFINSIYRYVKILRFKESVPVDTFTLSRQINLKKPDYALRILNQLLREGERPERILGGLRYVWEKDVTSPQEARRRLRFLLDCDLDIKTGRLKPLYALEKLVIKLCSAGKPFG
jgi:DNA polymerase III delta subunit